MRPSRHRTRKHWLFHRPAGRIRAWLVPLTGIVALATATGTLSAANPAAAAGAGCTVQYSTNDWDTGFTANITLRNEGDPITAWTLTWTFLDAQQVTQGWNGNFTQTGTAVSVTNMSYNGSLATGASTSLGFNGSKGAANRPPTDFAVNGTRCTGPNQAPSVSLTAPAAGASFTAPATVPLAATASDPDGTVAKVDFFVDTQLIATDTAAPFQGSWTNVPAGQYSITAKATDDKGAVTASAPVTIQVLAGPTILASPGTISVRQGGTQTFAVSLASQPSANVTVAVARGGGSTDLTAAPASLTFTSANWNTAQNVTVTSANNGGALGSATFTATATGYLSASVTANEISASASDYQVAFMTEYNKIKDPASGYFRRFGDLLVPYHAVETLIVEAPDYGHETTSEAFSYYLWLEATYGRITGDWAPLNAAWASLEKFAIPSSADQPTTSAYNPAAPATYAAEWPQPTSYPSQLRSDVPVGSDPLAGELRSTYGTSDVYGMHWLLDVDNRYGFGHCEDGTNTAPAFINTFQRGAQESVWETVTQPSCDTFKWGGPNGYLDLFTKDSSYAQQWKYTDAPDADARAVQVVYWARTWAAQQGKSADVASVVGKAAKLGDYLRYAMFDKYFKQVGNCVSPTACPGAQGRGSDDELLGWYYAWGGSLSTSGAWSWRIGDGTAHQGYQNPLAAYALSTTATGLVPQSPTAASDWGTSLGRQLEFYQWLQSAEGGIAGGATNSWDGQYGTPPAGDATFYGMAYDPAPVYHDPNSNTWFGFQTWSMERVAEYYDVTGDARAKAVLDKWVSWALANTTVGTNGAFAVPSDLAWTGQPATWNPTAPAANTGLHVAVTSTGQDVGVAASLAKTLMYYAARSGNTQARTTAEGLLTALMAHQDTQGISTAETRTDYNRFDDAFNATTGQGVFIPAGFTGKMPDGDPINASSTFLSIRSWYTSDPAFPKVQSYLNGGPAPSFTYHRFWAQSEIATAFAIHVDLFG
jgi:Glycosyl hydrolase family 48/Cellulose binding domain/Bacterial Ig domain